MEHIKMSILCFPHILAVVLQYSLGSFLGARSVRFCFLLGKGVSLSLLHVMRYPNRDMKRAK